MSTHYQAIDSFRLAMINALGCAPNHIDTSGKLTRFSTNGKSLDKAGYYGFFLEPIPAGFYGDFRTGIYQKWHDKTSGRVSAQAYAESQRKMAVIRQQAQQEREEAHKQAQLKAYEVWGAATPVDAAHPYLYRKQIRPLGIRQLGDRLIIPITDFDGVLHSYQSIAPNGDKRFLSGGRKKGMHYLMLKGSELVAGEPVILCEGFATGASLFDAFHLPVFVAFDAGNLLAVARDIRARCPDTQINLYADNDRSKVINTGVNAAYAVAAVVSGVQVFIPDFPPDAPLELSDFNDLVVWLNAKTAGRLAA